MNSFEQKQLTKWWLKKIEQSWRFRTLNWQAPFTTKQMRKWLYFIWLVYQGVAVKTIGNIPSKLYPFFFNFQYFFPCIWDGKTMINTIMWIMYRKINPTYIVLINDHTYVHAVPNFWIEDVFSYPAVYQRINCINVITSEKYTLTEQLFHCIN